MKTAVLQFLQGLAKEVHSVTGLDKMSLEDVANFAKYVITYAGLYDKTVGGKTLISVLKSDGSFNISETEEPRPPI